MTILQSMEAGPTGQTGLSVAKLAAEGAKYGFVSVTIRNPTMATVVMETTQKLICAIPEIVQV